MCVFIEIKLPGYPREEAGQLSKDVVNRGLLEICAQRQPRGEKGSRFLLGPSDHPCACGLGADRVDETGDRLQFDQLHIEKIEAVLRYLSSRAGAAGLRVRAWFEGGTHDRIPRRAEQKASVDDLIDKLRHDRLGGNVCYHISGSRLTTA